jgi:hypothetical protein
MYLDTSTFIIIKTFYDFDIYIFQVNSMLKLRHSQTSIQQE